MVARIANYIKKYDEEGNLDETVNYYKLERCTEESFERDYDKKYYALNKHRF